MRAVSGEGAFLRAFARSHLIEEVFIITIIYVIHTSLILLAIKKSDFSGKFTASK